MIIADRDAKGGQAFVDSLNEGKSVKVASFHTLDVKDWNQQAKVFGQAVAEYGHIDYVYPIAGIGERRWVPNNPSATSGFVQPDLSVLDIDLTGVMYTIALAIQQFRRQEPGRHGFRGKIGCVASVCGFYCVPTLPIYTAAKHAVTGFVRSYGKYLPDEKITLNSVNPNVIRTNISTSAFYDMVEERGLLTPVESVVQAFENLLGDNATSGEIFEVGPKGNIEVRPAPEYMDTVSKEVCDMLEKRGRPLHLPH